MSNTYYITTPLYYVNAAPHLGHSYTTVAADCLARFQRSKGAEVFLLTGTDEHGQKIAQAAQAAGQMPQLFVDQMMGRYAALWKLLNISHDDFIRTTQPRHMTAVQAILARLHEAGQLTRASYRGWYCTPDETFWTEAELADAAGAPRRGGCASSRRAIAHSSARRAGTTKCARCWRAPCQSRCASRGRRAGCRGGFRCPS